MISAAYRVLAATRSGGASVSDILAEAGLSTRAFYRHFRSKDDLLMAMFEAESERMATEVAELVEAAAGPRDALETWIGQNLEISFDPRRFRRAQVMLSPEMNRVAGYGLAQVRQQDRQRVELAAILAAGERDGSFAHTDPARDASLILDILHRIILRRHAGVEEMDHDACLRDVLDFVGRAIGLAR